MMYYAIMNDYKSSLIPRYLHALVDDKKQVNDSWEYDASIHSYPEFIADPQCPESIYLLCRKDVGALSFSYYKHGMGHIVSGDVSDVLMRLNTSGFYCKKMIATSIGSGDVLRDDFRYFYFVGDEGLIDLNASQIEEDKRGRKIPYNITFNDQAKNYDVFTIRETVLRGFLFVSSNVVSCFENIKGLKLVPLDKVLDNYCIDYGYDLAGNKKITKRKLP
ncbi:hypothetical protein J8658_03965 [Dickeya zeae]|nr:hypothetical protein [Dickeya parazeae]